MCDIIAEYFDLLPSPEGIVDDVVAVRKGCGSTKDALAVPFFSFSFPKGGMFVWMKLYLDRNPRYQTMLKESQSVNAAEGAAVVSNWTEAFWMDLIQEKVLLTPGSYYTPIIGAGNERMIQAQPDVTFFRLTFAFETREEMKLGVERMANVFEKWWT